MMSLRFFFFFNDTATTAIYTFRHTLSLHDALPIFPQIDFDAYVRKVKAGAHGVVTQYFYNADAYFDFVERSERAGLAVPVVPGIMPIVNTAQQIGRAHV